MTSHTHLYDVRWTLLWLFHRFNRAFSLLFPGFSRSLFFRIGERKLLRKFPTQSLQLYKYHIPPSHHDSEISSKFRRNFSRISLLDGTRNYRRRRIRKRNRHLVVRNHVDGMLRFAGKFLEISTNFLPYFHEISVKIPWNFREISVKIQPPYINEPPSKALMLITTQAPPPLQKPERWSRELKHFVNVCLQKDPKKRPVSIELLQVDFFWDFFLRFFSRFFWDFFGIFLDFFCWNFSIHCWDRRAWLEISETLY